MTIIPLNQTGESHGLRLSPRGTNSLDRSPISAAPRHRGTLHRHITKTSRRLHSPVRSLRLLAAKLRSDPSAVARSDRELSPH